MMKEIDPNEIFFTFKDLKKQFVKKKRVYLKVAVVCFSLVFLYKLVQEPQYEADAVFKQSDSRQDHSELVRSFLKNVSGFTQDASGQIVMQSRSLLKQVVQELGMQARVKDQSLISTFSSRLFANLLAEIGCNLREKESFVFRNVLFEEKKPFSFFLRFVDGQFYEILDGKKQVIAKAKVGQLICTPQFSFVLEHTPTSLHPHRLYKVQLDPWLDVVKKAIKKLKIKVSKTDKKALLLVYQSNHSVLAAEFLNHLMGAYQEYLRKENEEIAEAQLSYLEKRQLEFLANYEKALDEHVVYLSQSLGENGFINLKQEIEILEKPKEEYLSKLFDVELELHRLKPKRKEIVSADKERKKDTEKQVDKESRKIGLTSTKTNAEVEKKEKQKEQEKKTDLLPYEKQYALIEKRHEDIEFDKQKIEQVLLSSAKCLEEVFAQKEALKKILDYTEGKSRDLPVFTTTQLKDPVLAQYLQDMQNDHMQVSLVDELKKKQIQAQMDKRKELVKQQVVYRQALLQEEQNRLQESKEQFIYGAVDLQGISPEAAQKLYIDYNNQLDSIRINMQQLVYLQDKILDPDFELSSLSSILTDSVSQEMIRKASSVALELRDVTNRSFKDHERLKETLAMQKNFLKLHIAQTIDMQKLQAKLIEQKITSLQESFVHLLETEKGLIEDRLQAMQERMRSLPEKWKMENQLMLKRDLSIGMIEGLTHLAESKSIDYRLFNVESKPIDFAIIPRKPVLAYLFPLSLLAALFSVSIIYIKDILCWMNRGTPISEEALQLFGVHCSGILSKDSHLLLEELSTTDRETLRKIAYFIATHKRAGSGVCAAAIGDIFPNFTKNLTQLLHLRGMKVLVIECYPDLVISAEYQEGLLSYLNGEIAEPPLYSLEGYDFIPAGKYTPYGAELLSRVAFTNLLEGYRRSYDCILLSSKVLPNSSAIYSYLERTDVLIAYAGPDETMSDLKAYVDWQKENETQRLTVIFRET